MALTVTNATGPRPVSMIARRSRSASSGLGGRLASRHGPQLRALCAASIRL